MDYLINTFERGALCGLPHLQQLAYLVGIRPYMDIKTGMVGIKRGISYQSIAESLYVEPHQGIKSETCSRAQIQRALAALKRVGLITMHSQGLKLILKCELASAYFSVQNKVDAKPLQEPVIDNNQQHHENNDFYQPATEKADTAPHPKADTPLKDNSDLYLFAQFEKFWSLYPQKKSKQNAQAVFEQINPDERLFVAIMKALEAQIIHTDSIQARGMWIPNWKYPANWLAQRCWEDEISTHGVQEKHHAEHTKNPKKYRDNDPFSPPSDDEERSTSNVIQLQQYR